MAAKIQLTTIINHMTTTLEAGIAPSIDQDVISLKGKQCLRFEFKGHFNQEICHAATEAWSKRFEEKSDESFDLLWDCTQMDGFDYDAKNDWVETLGKYADRINSIYVVSDSVLIRGAARVMGKFSKYDMRVFKAMDELNANL